MPVVTGPSRPDELDVSVVVAAHTMDRWDDIVTGVEALAQQTLAALETILVVDHNDDLLARARSELPAVRVVENLGPRGVSGARNTGIAEAKAPVIAFLDDDARPEPDWLERLMAAYDEDDVMVVGGSAAPAWPASGRPDHLPPELDWVVGCTYRGQPTVRTDVRNPFGCNMSVRRTAFDVVGTFNERRGRAQQLPLGTEETELCIRIRQQMPGARVVFEPAARVHHRVTEDRTTWRYLRLRSHAEGVSKATMVALVGTSDGMSEERAYVRSVLPRGVLRELGRGLRGDVAGFRGAAGIVVCLATTGWWYVRSRLGRRATAAR
jgi:glucosyl-dolichyl phosphate glucuronosyltransferase